MYSTPQGGVRVEVIVKDETVWVTQKAMAELFGVQIPAISKHLGNIYEEGELQQDSTLSKMEIVQNEGGRDVARLVDFYNLDAIISWANSAGRVTEEFSMVAFAKFAEKAI